jgi:hypothetical protein
VARHFVNLRGRPTPGGRREISGRRRRQREKHCHCHPSRREVLGGDTASAPFETDAVGEGGRYCRPCCGRGTCRLRFFDEEGLSPARSNGSVPVVTHVAARRKLDWTLVLAMVMRGVVMAVDGRGGSSTNKQIRTSLKT